MRSLAASVVCLIVLGGTAAAEFRGIRTYDPRPFGYFVGDTIERSFEVDTEANDKLDVAFLPRPGAINYWLELRDVSYKTTIESGRATHAISLAYQTFYAPIDPHKISIPELRVSVTTEKGREDVVLPAFTFIANPIREIFPEKSGETSETFLRPDPVPTYISAASAVNALILSAAIAALTLALLARHLAWWPFSARRARPFAKAARDIAHVLYGVTDGPAARREAAIILHRAFDESAGLRLFVSDIPRFLEQRPEHQASAEAIASFFQSSRAMFFGAGPGTSNLSTAQLGELAARLRAEERGAR